ncbi:MAG TPA: hypothetical protein VFX12_02315 [Vicinamibacterales bacterium]|nr:hypothetical protein [Vicinamibacterales bacterium]
MRTDEQRHESPEPEKPKQPEYEKGMEEEEGEGRNIESQMSEVGLTPEQTFDDDLNPVDLYEEEHHSER